MRRHLIRVSPQSLLPVEDVVSTLSVPFLVYKKEELELLSKCTVANPFQSVYIKNTVLSAYESGKTLCPDFADVRVQRVVTAVARIEEDVEVYIHSFGKETDAYEIEDIFYIDKSGKEYPLKMFITGNTTNTIDLPSHVRKFVSSVCFCGTGMHLLPHNKCAFSGRWSSCDTCRLRCHEECLLTVTTCPHCT